MSPVRSTVLAVLAIGALGTASFFGTIVAHIVLSPDVYVLPLQTVEVPVVDQASCVELLAAEVNQPASNCVGCHTTGIKEEASTELLFYYAPIGDEPIPGVIIDGWLEIPTDNGADSDTGR